MIKILEDIQQGNYMFNDEKLKQNNEVEYIQNIIDEILIPLPNNVKIQSIDPTNMPDEFDVYFEYEIEPGKNEYIGMWEIDCNKENIKNYSAYLIDISNEIDAAISGLNIN